MKILSITGGAGNMYCGSCLKDNNLAAELRKQGHDVILLPLYTPTRTDEENVSRRDRVFFGGISIYLQQEMALFRKTPKFLDKLWDMPGVIARFAGRGVEVDAAKLGALTVSMLEGVAGHQRKEIDHLVEWLRSEPAPDLVTIPYTLLISLAKPLKQAIGRPIICLVQGEELYLEQLAEPWRTKSIDLIRRQVDDVDAFIAPSRYNADFMARFLAIPREKIHVVPLGVKTERFGLERRTKNNARVVGFFGRVAPEKGLHMLADAYRILRSMPGVGALRLEAAGYLPPEKKSYLAEIEANLRDTGEFRYWGEVDAAGKARFLQNCDVFSLPCTYDEPKGLPVLEAMANGVPVVQPARGSFPEMVETAGGGLLVTPVDSPQALAEGLHRLLTDTALALRLGRAGYEGVRRHYDVGAMARRTAEVYRAVCEPAKMEVSATKL